MKKKLYCYQNMIIASQTIVEISNKMTQNQENAAQIKIINSCLRLGGTQIKYPLNCAR